jgi:O-antigen ligase
MAEGMISTLAQQRRDDPGLPGLKWSAAHNSFVQAGAELGIPGLILFLTLVFGPVVGLTRLRGRLPPEWARGTREEQFLYFATVYLPVAFVGFGFAGFFVSFAYVDLLYVLAALTIGTYVSVERYLQHGRSVVRVTPGALPDTLRRSWRGGLPPQPPDVDQGPRFAPR